MSRSNVNLRAQLQAIYDQHGALTAALVVDAARPRNHPLHGHIFDRARPAAAESWYLHRAEVVIRSVTVRRRGSDGQPLDVRAFSPVREDAPGVYDPIEDIVLDDAAVKRLLVTMEVEWRAMKRRYDDIVEFWEMVRKDAAA